MTQVPTKVLPKSVTLTVASDAVIKRRRKGFKPEDDRLIYQSLSLIMKYVGGSTIPWIMMKNVLPGRKDTSIKRRWGYLQVKMKTAISRFLSIFEKHYIEQEQKGLIKTMENGAKFDLRYYLDWYNNGNFQKEEEIVEVQR